MSTGPPDDDDFAALFRDDQLLHSYQETPGDPSPVQVGPAQAGSAFPAPPGYQEAARRSGRRATVIIIAVVLLAVMLAALIATGII